MSESEAKPASPIPTVTCVQCCGGNDSGSGSGGGGGSGPTIAQCPVLQVTSRMLRSPSHESVTTDLSLFSVSSIASDLRTANRLVTFKSYSDAQLAGRGPSPKPDRQIQGNRFVYLNLYSYNCILYLFPRRDMDFTINVFYQASGHSRDFMVRGGERVDPQLRSSVVSTRTAQELQHERCVAASQSGRSRSRRSSNGGIRFGSRHRSAQHSIVGARQTRSRLEILQHLGRRGRARGQHVSASQPARRNGAGAATAAATAIAAILFERSIGAATTAATAGTAAAAACALHRSGSRQIRE